MTTKIKLDENEGGSALALVLFFIVLVSLWLGSVALLTQASSSAIKTNIAASQERSDLVDFGIQAALTVLTRDPTCSQDIDNPSWSISCRSGTQVLPCSNSEVLDEINTELARLTSPTPPVEVQCGNSDQSGFEDLGALILVGDGTNCVGADCKVGQDGGLAIDPTGASDTTTPACSSSPAGTTDSSRYMVYGSVVNLSGNWDTVNCDDFEIAKKTASDPNPQIFQRAGGDELCLKALNCGVLTQWGGQASGLGLPRSTLTQSKLNAINAYVSHIADNLDSFPSTSSLAKISPAKADCSTNFNPGKSITISQGYIKQTTTPEERDAGVLSLVDLNKLTSDNACGDGTDQPAIIFESGVYGFPGSLSIDGNPVSSSTENTWTVSFDGTIFAGLTSWQNDGTSESPCGSSPTNTGVRFLFKNYSYFKLLKGKFVACAFPTPDPRELKFPGSKFPKLIQPIFSAPAKTSYSNPGVAKFWWGSGAPESTGAFYTSNNGSATLETKVSANFVGPIFAPASWLDINLNGDTVSTFKNGIIAKGLTIKITSSGPPTKSISSSGILSAGDRQVQLNFFRSSTKQYLGSLQLKIDDSGGYKLASGYIRKLWRVGW